MAREASLKILINVHIYSPGHILTAWLSGFVPPLKCVPPPILCSGLSLNQ